MFKVQVTNNLSGIMNKIDMLNINIQSSVAEAVAAAEPEIRDLFNSNYDEADVEIVPSASGVEVNIKNHYGDISNEVKDVILNKLRSKFGGVE